MFLFSIVSLFFRVSVISAHARALEFALAYRWFVCCRVSCQHVFWTGEREHRSTVHPSCCPRGLPGSVKSRRQLDSGVHLLLVHHPVESQHYSPTPQASAILRWCAVKLLELVRSFPICHFEKHRACALPLNPYRWRRRRQPPPCSPSPAAPSAMTAACHPCRSLRGVLSPACTCHAAPEFPSLPQPAPCLEQ